MNPIQPFRIALSMLLGFAGTAHADPQPTTEQGWIAIQGLMFSQALSAFQSEPTANTPSARLGQAVALLHKQPTTRGHIEEALSILESLARDESGSEEALQAAYLRARVIQLHPFEPDPRASLPLYHALVTEAPRTLIGQLAFLKWAGIELYSGDVDDRDVPFAAIEADGEFLSDPDCRRSFHLLLAEAGQRRHHDDDFVLRHYLSAYEAGLAKPDLQANVLTRIIVLEQKTGRTDQARAHAELFIAAYPRDIRITQIGEIIGDPDSLKR
ncbi:MAG: hypothetical protein R3F07_11215 [Opitutaceae bacterium]